MRARGDSLAAATAANAQAAVRARERAFVYATQITEENMTLRHGIGSASLRRRGCIRLADPLDAMARQSACRAAAAVFRRCGRHSAAMPSPEPGGRLDPIMQARTMDPLAGHRLPDVVRKPPRQPYESELKIFRIQTFS